jgi:glycogen(starch) synthase
MQDNRPMQEKPNGKELHIAHFSWEFPPAIWGGLGTFALEITQKQAALGNKVTVFAINDKNKLVSSEQFNGVEIFRPYILNVSSGLYTFSNADVKSWGSHFSFFSTVMSYNIMSAAQLVECLVRKQGRTYDIIDGHDWLGISGGMIAHQELDVPLIFHVHSTELGRSGGRGSSTIHDIERQGGDQADGVITVSHAMKDELKYLGFPQEKIHVCWNGIDPMKYNPETIPRDEVLKLRRKYGIADDDILLFFIGRLVTIKGVENLVRSLPGVVKDFPKVKLLILGVGELEHTLRSIIEDYRLSDHVILRTDFVNEPERILHYAASDIVILPSLYEPFGIVCTEAMSMGKPVVVGARGVSGMREQIISNGEQQCGVHINPYDPRDIAWGIKLVLESQEKRVLMGANARRRVLEEFSWDAVTKRTLGIYQEFLQ